MGDTENTDLAANVLEAQKAYISNRDGRVDPNVINTLAKNGLSKQNLAATQNQNSNAATNGEAFKSVPIEGAIITHNTDFVVSSKSTANVAEASKLFQPNKEAQNKIDLTGLEMAASRVTNETAKAALDKAGYLADKDLQKHLELANQQKPEIYPLAKPQVKEDSVQKEFAGFYNGAIDANEELYQGKFKSFDKVEAEVIRNEAQLQQARAAQAPIDQVKVKVMKGFAEGLDKVAIKLFPAELGKVNVEMEVAEDGKTSIRIMAERAETLDMLKKDAEQLTRALKDVGMKSEANDLQFSLRDGGANQFGGNQDNNPGGEFLKVPELENLPEISKYENMDVQELILNVEDKGLDIVA